MNCGYSFKQEAKVYVVDKIDPADSGTWLIYQIDVSEVNFSQSFLEHSYSNKSIQNPNMFEQSVINKANPANFDISFSAIREDDFRILFDKALDYQSFDIYVETEADQFLVELCVITNANFMVEKLKPLGLGVSGQGAKVQRFDPGTAILGTVVPRAGTKTYNRISALEISLGDTTPVTLSDFTTSVSIELQNEVKWTPYVTVNGALAVTEDGAMYPEAYTISKRILAGSVTQYLTDTNNTNLLQWSTSTPLNIKVGQISGIFYGFELNMATVSFTNRVTPNDIFTQSYDWRSTENPIPPATLSSIVTYTTT